MHLPREAATELSSLLSCIHGRERRLERNIEKVDLQRARRYGMQEPSRFGRHKYTYGGVVFIYDPNRNMEVTSFRSPDAASSTSGTKHTKPVLLPKFQFYDKSSPRAEHAALKRKLHDSPESWRSHSVVVVDMSGSMRRDDVSGARCRSDGVWMVLARDFVKDQLVNNAVSPETDVMSVVLMRETAETVIDCEPIDWVLYNKLIEMREWSSNRPRGPGNYMPALFHAEKLLAKNKLGSCALSLVFISDGRPSDSGPFAETMGRIASKYRRRLTVACIAMADAYEFQTLEDMVNEADAYGAVSSFSQPSLDTQSISSIVSTLASSVTSTKTEITDMKTGKTKSVRVDVRCERRGTVDDTQLTPEWIVLPEEDPDNCVLSFWAWDSIKDDFVIFRDPRCWVCFETCVGPSVGPRVGGLWCPDCKSIAFCASCWQIEHMVHLESKECKQWQRDRRQGKVITDQLMPSFSVAFKEPIFGEGAERIVRRFRFLDKKKQFVGPKMVAKESRFTSTNERKRSFHALFMRTQVLASDFADRYNHHIDQLVHQFDDEVSTEEWVRQMPRIEFLRPLVVEYRDELDGVLDVLIEPFLEGKYEKFNNNAGFVKGQSTSSSLVKPDAGADRLGSRNLLNDLGVIEEGSEEEDESDDDGELIDGTICPPESGSYSYKYDPLTFAQAFSHFTYERSKGALIVVDLQGVFSDEERTFRLTDPAIHRRKKSDRKRMQFGRTDKGKAGIVAFFRSHKCSDACRLLGLSNVDPETI